MTKIAIFASGNGSNFEAVINYFKNTNIEFVCVSNNKNAFVLKRAEKLNIKSYIVEFENTYEFLQKNKFDLIVLAGYMRILPENVLKTGTFINIHPSLLPEFKGKNAIERAYNAKVKQTGVSIHYVTKEVDSGEIIAQKIIPVSNGMSLKELEDKIHETEHNLLPVTIEKLIKKYNVLLIGSGAREHALAYKIKQSPKLNKLYLYGANDGFKYLGENIKAENYEQLAKKASEIKIDILIIGPEQPLADGIVDIFEKYNINCIGSDKYWTQLESSKSFAKKFMDKYHIPTAKYIVTDTLEDIDKIPFNFPYVIKADGLAAGKGVCIVNNKQEAQNTIKDYLNGKFKEASKMIVVEEFLQGNEISLISLWDGKTLLPFIPARDYKKFNNLNTGGMGAVCPVETDKIQTDKYIKLLENALRKEKADFKGIIYSGLILTKDGIKVLEYNMRFGDPETQVLMLSMESDLLDLFINTLNQKLSSTKIKWKETPSGCVVLAAKGYPQQPELNDKITINENIKSAVFFAGVQNINNELYSSGGRVLSVCINNDNPFDTIYKDINKIHFNNKVFRNDIGQ